MSSFELNEYVQVFLLFFYTGLAHPHHCICPLSGPRTWILSMSSLCLGLKLDRRVVCIVGYVVEHYYIYFQLVHCQASKLFLEYHTPPLPPTINQLVSRYIYFFTALHYNILKQWSDELNIDLEGNLGDWVEFELLLTIWESYSVITCGGWFSPDTLTSVTIHYFIITLVISLFLILYCLLGN